MILMEKVLEEIEFLLGVEIRSVQQILSERSFEIFSSDTCDFLSHVSTILLKSPNIRNFPDVATFAFFCRKANLNSLKKNSNSDSIYRVGRGILFHITPGNVPVNFAYSMFAGLMTGNINFVKVPSRNFEQIDIIVDAIKTAFLNEKYKSLFSNRLFLVRYNRDSIATSFFSAVCDVRIIWGGDDTIKDIRKIPIPPKSTEVTFSDRYSICIIKAENYSNLSDKLKVAIDFYNDTYLFDQNACTSPQTVFWYGTIKQVDKAQKEFWSMVEIVLNEKKFEVQPISSIDKLTTFYSQSISFGDITMVPRDSNSIWRVKNSKIHHDIDQFRCSSGYFNEIIISSLDELSDLVNRKYQTIAYIGLSKEELKAWVTKSNPLGIDRIVPIGRTMDFSLNWDGYNLVNALSRSIEII